MKSPWSRTKAHILKGQISEITHYDRLKDRRIKTVIHEKMTEKEIPAVKYMSAVRLAIPVCNDWPRYCCLNATYQPKIA